MVAKNFLAKLSNDKREHVMIIWAYMGWVNINDASTPSRVIFLPVADWRITWK
jgi:hypothetical protein